MMHRIGPPASDGFRSQRHRGAVGPDRERPLVQPRPAGWATARGSWVSADLHRRVHRHERRPRRRSCLTGLAESRRIRRSSSRSPYCVASGRQARGRADGILPRCLTAIPVNLFRFIVAGTAREFRMLVDQ